MKSRLLMMFVTLLFVATTTTAASPGYVVPATEGETIRCDAHVTLTVKLRSPETLPNLLAGVARVRGSSQVRLHRDAEEVIHVNRGWGHAVIHGRRVALAAGSVLRIPAGVSSQFISSGSDAIEYLFVLSDANASPCGSAGDSSAAQITELQPGEGERITYCLFPLTITAKIDKESVPDSVLTMATGELRAGKEDATHKTSDEIVFVTRGRAQAIVGDRQVPVTAGALMVTPRGNYHGFIHEGNDTLNYVIVFTGTTTRAAFRALASREGRFCPAAITAESTRSAGYVLEPSEGEPLIFCDSPNLRVNIKVSPQTTGDAPLALGTAQLMGSNTGTHRDQDEVIYFTGGSGSAFVGDINVRIRPGVTMYVPRGVRHGFEADTAEPVTFMWAIAPPGLEKRFRESGHPPAFDCNAGKHSP
jgi:mannose-6-phosphate isomerase-like protein (cupin superfamily)